MLSLRDSMLVCVSMWMWGVLAADSAVYLYKSPPALGPDISAGRWKFTV